DPNSFVNGIPSDEYRALMENDHKPLYHKAVKGIYPPGSTFKMMTAIAALKAGVVDPKDRFPCSGYYPFGNRVFHCWKRGGHGPQDMHGGIKNSCDCYFYELAKRAGPDYIADVARAFGFGQAFDIGISDVSKGLVPDSAWKLKKRKAAWQPGESLSYGIGQGYLIVTPLQLAVMAARIGNGGRAVSPRLYRERGLVASAEPKPPVSMGVDAQAILRVQDGMWAVCNEPGGTAIVAGQINIPGMQIAGKTGTAQVRNMSAGERAGGVISNDNLPWKLRDHGLFVCYGPTANPRYACSVVIDHGGSGSKAAGPVARDIMHEVLLKDPASKPAFTRITAETAAAAQKGSPA
ncbi:MAG: penicillin-binding transpeptidase domain-containing protein, partial [Caulobacterales bacterium]